MLKKDFEQLFGFDCHLLSICLDRPFDPCDPSELSVHIYVDSLVKRFPALRSLICDVCEIVIENYSVSPETGAPSSESEV